MKYLLWSALFLTLVSCHTRLKQANKRGLEFMRQQQYEEAVMVFDQIIDTRKEWFPAYYNRAVSYANTRQYLKALKDFNYILSHFPDHVQTYFNRAILYENQGEYAKAIKDYSEAIRLSPNYIQAYHYRGIARFQINDLNGALTDYNKAIELGKGISMDASAARETGLNSSALFFNRGVIMQKKGQQEAAVRDYSEAIRIDPSSAKAYYNRGIAHISLNQYAEAKNDLEISEKLGFTPAQQALSLYFPSQKK